MTDLRTVPPNRLPLPTTLSVECPCCGGGVEYAPAEDDAGAFYALSDWPICDGCGILIDVPPVRIIRANDVYLQKG